MCLVESFAARDGSLLLEVSAHKGPLSDPDWASGAGEASMPVLGALTWVTFCVAHELLALSISMAMLTATSILALGISWTIVCHFWVVKERKRVRQWFCENSAVRRVPGDEHRELRCVCRGHEIELARLVRKLPTAQRATGTVRSPRYLFLCLVGVLFFLGGVPVEFWDWPASTPAIAIIVAALFGFLAHKLFGARAEVGRGQLKLTDPMGGLLAGPRQRTIELRDAHVVCDFTKNIAEVQAPTGDYVRLDLWSLPRRHEFAHALFRAALETQ